MQRKERSTLSSAKAEPKEKFQTKKQGMEGIKQSIKRMTSPGSRKKKRLKLWGGNKVWVVTSSDKTINERGNIE